jgi:molybdate transport system ATP-binding protein
MIVVRVDLVKRIGTLEIQAGFRLAQPGILALFGPSGSGKTSIVNMIAGLLEPDQGSITAGEVILFDSEQGVNLPPPQRRIGYIFQDGRLFPHLNVWRNLNYGRRTAPPGKSSANLDEIVEVLDIGHLLERRPHHLSQGEKQRVAMGRALVTSPRLLLMDEPLSSVDDARKLEILALISSLPPRFKIPILYVSHSMEELEALSAEVVRLETCPASADSKAPRTTRALGPRT